MKLAFGILCAREDPATIAQLVDSLGPDALVLIHHDVSKRPTPDLRGRPNVRFVRDPVITGWGEWSLCAAILRLLRDGLAEPRWDYFQLLSGSCLPIKRVDAFERFLEASRADANVDMVALDEDPVALMSHGFRAFAPADSLRHRALRRLRRWYLGDRPRWVNRQGLGFALPAGIGAKFGVGERPVAVMIGDYGLQYTINELGTAAEHKLPIVILMWNNDALGQIRDDMVMKGIQPNAVTLRNPDFQALARAYGMEAEKPATLRSLAEAIRKALKAEGPTLIEMTPRMVSG